MASSRNPRWTPNGSSCLGQCGMIRQCLLRTAVESAKSTLACSEKMLGQLGLHLSFVRSTDDALCMGGKTFK